MNRIRPSQQQPHDAPRQYWVVFAALIFLTFLVVLVSSLHLNKVLTVILLLLIAGGKAGLVACYFMHLLSERHVIYGFLVLTLVVLVSLLLLPVLQAFNAV
jgi:cytochrome c oxidase subunit 4